MVARSRSLKNKEKFKKIVIVLTGDKERFDQLFSNYQFTS